MAAAIDGQDLTDIMDGTIPCALEGERQSLTNMPQAVAGAINAVMGRIKGLLKTERNRAGGYRFASIDDFLSAVNPLCAKAGLIILQDELDARLVHDGTEHSNRSWLWATFTFTLAHKSGALYGPLTRSVMVPASGAQAFGAAQSYALKQFMRSLFQIPTGDREDADYGAPERLPGQCRYGFARRGNGKSGRIPDPVTGSNKRTPTKPDTKTATEQPAPPKNKTRAAATR